MDSLDLIEFSETLQMLPPPPGSFLDREELIQHVGEFALSQGYVVTIKQSRKDRDVILGCDRGGVYRSRRKTIDEASGENARKRKTGSRLTNCPFECLGKKDDGFWVLTIKNGSHNHEPLKDISEHPSARRFSESEVLLIKEMTEAGLKPRQILKRLRQSNPELLSTPKHVYNIKSRLRQGNPTVKRFKTLRPQTSGVGNSNLPTTSEPSWRQRNPPRVPNLIAGRFVDSQSLVSIDVINPASQQVVCQVPLTTPEEFKAAVFAAKRAFSSWRSTPVTTRQRLMFKLQELIRRDIDKLAMNITSEQGKTLKDSYSEVLRGLEVVEHACGMASLQMGEFASNISYGTDSYSIREPLGVCAGICPSNFPAMVPLWMFPMAVTCGNTFILKPCERDPGASVILAELAVEAGLPKGVLNIVHGTHDIMNSICDDDDIKAVSFVGSDTAGVYVFERASASGKRVQCNRGAKNHAIVMPDASMDATLNVLVATGFGAAGQRCMAISTVVFVGGSNLWEDKLVELAKSLIVNAGTESDADLGPVISKQAKERLCRLIQSGIDSGAKLALDGRNIVVPRYELGNFIGPTILSDVRVEMECYKEEIFGPVLLCMEADSLEEAINLVNRNKYSSGASIFTTSAAAASKFQSEIEAGQVGINVPVAASLPFFSSNGSKASFSGDLNFSGKAELHFYTKVKTVTRQWQDFPSSDGVSLGNTESLAFTTSDGSQQIQDA
ncbi:methylmalonate-semialdehyde dehydrogenase [acylating], mitochondrial-like [Rhododendron vialii]|uniref:methylmalonate-semialdehyde dehydrogenase [acylating], mitochondrial-like n=1 Tax=Rhododendron vialii TaxID=182163 RepID=UPI00265F5D29|nr:methylmalonate-semialdehyde dehydrogenase [acylating], mitochondrial-like [Rhododendron vialii]XP_058213994.1 methylmalonate-semialdehyde dehydrogenase [acylating], mitochondrial-like [Rhododendron vialii]XP_058213995.1 methylmalonate-semialdehyde dehydrogenase [acylating], mitochondrial-like [Rhododendron vialii]